MTKEKRKGEKPIPDDIDNYLNEEQREVLEKIEAYGWNLKFIRRPCFKSLLLWLSILMEIRLVFWKRMVG